MPCFGIQLILVLIEPANLQNFRSISQALPDPPQQALPSSASWPSSGLVARSSEPRLMALELNCRQCS